jgi:hypothetical protein
MECLQCKAVIPAEDVNLDNLLAKCRNCGEVFSFADAMQRPVGVGGRGLKLPAPQPDSLRVEEFAVNTPGILGPGRQIMHRWFSWPILLLGVFCVAWDSFLVNWYWEAFNNPGFQGQGQWQWLMIVFPLPHLAVGVGLTYFVLAGLLNYTIVQVCGTELTVRQGPLPWKGNRRLDAATIIQLYCDQTSTWGKEWNSVWPQHNVNALLANERKLKLLSGLRRDQALFYEERLEEWLGIEPYPVSGEVEK